MLREAEVSDPEARAYLVALLAGCGIAFFLALHATLAGVLNGLGWFAVSLFLGLIALTVLYLLER